ncbi:hypothetical protein MMC19_001229 [Ptychographa xylographoides]|nr:hypothetical protein [Ptychographa xylographoides]
MSVTGGHTTLAAILPLFILTIFTATAGAQQASSSASPSVPSGEPFPPGGGAPSAETGYGAPTGITGIANYYYVLIGIVAILFLVGFFLIRGRHRRHYARRRAAGELPADIEGSTWAGRPWRSAAVRDPRRDEGLNEEGEAPPAYLPGEERPPYFEGEPRGEGIALHELTGKPPDYDGHGSSSEDLNLTRPSPAHPPNGRHHWARNLLGRGDSAEGSTAVGTDVGTSESEPPAETSGHTIEHTTRERGVQNDDGVIR